MKMSVSEFKAKCTHVLRNISNESRAQVEITNRGKVIAVISSPQPESKLNPAWGALKGRVTRLSSDFDEPLGDADWDACQ